MKIFNSLVGAFNWLLKGLDLLTPIFDLAARLWVAFIFFKAGVLKAQSWQGTLFLFENEFNVPLIPASWAAVLGTGAELILPVLLAFGLGGRIIILIFFIYNLISTISYPFLWTAEGGQALAHHICWGLLLGLLMCHGSGKLSVDYWICKKYGKKFLHPQR